MTRLHRSRQVALLLMIIMLSAGAGCKHGERSGSADTQLPPDLLIMFGQQGTFAGRGAGYSIDAAGDVVRWEGKYPGEDTTAAAAVGRDQVQELWNRAREIGFLSMQDQEMASMYYFVSVTAGGESRRVTWTAREQNASTPAQAFYDECLETARLALGEKM